MTTMRISILAYQGCMGMEIFGLCDTLLIANRVAQSMAATAIAPLFEVSLVSLAGGEVKAAGALRIGTHRAGRKATDLLVIPGMELSDRAACLQPLTRLASEVAFIRRAFGKGTPVAALCVGAFLLGEAGLLDQRRATTAWLFATELARRFPGARVDPAALLVDDGGVTTTGAFSATFDLAMHLIRTRASAKVARAVARMTLLDAGRASQAPYLDTRMLATPSAPFAASVGAWLEQRLAQPYDLALLAAAFHVSTRTMLRRFGHEAGVSPLGHLQQARINKAKLLLETSGHSLARITEQVGYADVATFGTLFKRIVGQSPAQYRRSFKTAAPQ
jgi:transcriptional regulator GlxA family with amidase domain